MYGEEGRGSGAIQGGGGGREKRGRSQSISSSSSSSDEEGEDPPQDEMKIKRVCKGGGGESEGGETDSEGEGEYGQWVREEMEQLEEQGEWEQTWGEYKDRSKRRREWDRGGWERWEIKEEMMGEAMATTPTTASPGFPQEHLGGHAVGGGGAMAGRERDTGAIKINESGATVGARGRCDKGETERENMGANEGVEGVERGGDDVKGGGGRRKRVNPAVNNQFPQRPTLRGRRRGGEGGKSKGRQEFVSLHGALAGIEST